MIAKLKGKLNLSEMLVFYGDGGYALSGDWFAYYFSNFDDFSDFRFSIVL